MTVKEQVISLFNKHNELTIRELVDITGASKQMLHLVMKQFVEEKKVIKLGRTPKTIYRLHYTPTAVNEPDLGYKANKEQGEFLQKNFLLITELGNLLEGFEAFTYWCTQRKLPVEKTLQEYQKTQHKFAPLYNVDGNVNGTEKLNNTKEYKNIYLDNIFYLDFYAIERFGKTRLGTILHYAKQGQNKFLMKMLVNETQERIIQFVKKNKADAVCFVPPTIRRELQLMKYIQTHTNVSLPVIDIKKISGLIPIPQKSLNKMEERITNAENTFAITDSRKFKHIVLIDDAVGSGATMNQIAGKLKAKGVAKQVTGLAMVGSLKGFDVITDV